MQLKISINNNEKLTLTSFDRINVDDLQDLISLFGELIPNITIKSYLLDHDKMKSYLVYKQNKNNK